MSDASGSPRRYPRTTNGLVASLVVTVLAVAAFVVFRAVGRTDLEVEPEPVDYQEAVTAAEGAGLHVVHPRSLPQGWIATSIDLDRGRSEAWGLGILTDSGSFVGIRQEDESVDSLLETYVDKDPDQGPEVTLDSDVATSWQTWSDTGGDHAFSSEVGKNTVLVYGSASEADQRELIGLLER